MGEYYNRIEYRIERGGINICYELDMKLTTDLILLESGYKNRDYIFLIKLEYNNEIKKALKNWTPKYSWDSRWFSS